MNFPYQKIMIFGRTGSGKSTFAVKLHKKTQIPIHHLDKHFYTSNWVERDHQEFLQIQQSLVDQSSWIIDGNSIKSLEMRYSKADLVLYFNFPRWLCYIRIFKRLFNKDNKIKDRADGCREIIRFRLLRYTWSFEDRVLDKLKKLKEKYPHVKFIEIRSDKDLDKLTNNLFGAIL